MKLTEAQRREWELLMSGESADLDILERAGLVECGVEIKLSGTRLARIDFVDLTEAGRAALRAEEAP